MSLDCFNLFSRLQDLVIVQGLYPKVILKENKMKIIMKYYAIKENNLKMTQKEISEKLGISTRTIARYKIELGCKEEIKTGKNIKDFTIFMMKKWMNLTKIKMVIIFGVIKNLFLKKMILLII